MGSVSKTVSKITMKVICLLLVLVAAASAFETCGKKGSGSRIINGVDAGHGEFPWQISLRFGRYGHICGGTLIGKQHVLCAAHCFGQTKNPNSYTVRVGEWHLKRRDGSEEDHAVSEVHVHERYNYPKQLNNDIAIMKLKTPSTFLDHMPDSLACLLLARTTADTLSASSLDGGLRRPPHLPQWQRYLRCHRCCLFRSRHLLRQTRCLHRGLRLQGLALCEVWWNGLRSSFQFFFLTLCCFPLLLSD